MGIFRLLLAIAVVISHTKTPDWGGFSYINSTIAVEMFFVISGFYIQMVLSEKYTQSRLGSNWVMKFYKARYFRLFPAYLICLVLSTLYFFIKKDFDYSEYSVIPTESIYKIFNLPATPENILLWIWYIFSNIFMFFQDFVLFIHVVGQQSYMSLKNLGGDFYIPDAMLIPQAWSIGIELLFYIMAPYLLGFKTRTLFLIGGSLLFVKMIFISLQPHDIINMTFWYENFPSLAEGKQWLMSVGTNLGWRADMVYRFFPLELPYFLAGALAFRFRKNLNFFRADVSKKTKSYQLMAVYFIVFMITMILPSKGYEYSIPLILLAGLLIPTFFYVTSDLKYDNFIGELSYPVYIFHILCLIFAANTWEALDGLAVFLKINHDQLITVMTLFFTLGLSAAFVLFERNYINPKRQKLSISKVERST